MSGVSRFHDKLHRSNHHTLSTVGLLESAYDPIASPEFPFQGTFAVNGAISGSGGITGNNLTVSNDANIRGSALLDGSLNVAGSLVLGDYTYPFTRGGLLCDISGTYNTPNLNQFSLVIGYANGVYIQPWLNVPSISATSIYSVSGFYNIGSIGRLNTSDLSANTTITNNLSTTNAYVATRLGIGTTSPQYALHVVGDAVFSGTITSTGSAQFVNTIFSTTSALSVLNVGTGPAIVAVQTGEQPIAAFYDDNNIALYIDGTTVRPGFVGVKTRTPNEALTVAGNISATGILYGSIPGYNNVQSTSATWNTTYTQLNVSSGFWQSNYSTVNANSATWSAAGGSIVSGNISYAQLTASSGFWQSNYSIVNASSAAWNSNSGLLGFNTLTASSGAWQSTYTAVSQTSSRWDTAYNQLTSLSSGWVLKSGDTMTGNLENNVSIGVSSTSQYGLRLTSNQINTPGFNGVAEVAVNYSGFSGGTTQFRNFNVYDGKNNSLFFVNGSTGAVGVGTTTPVSFKLDVNGFGRFNDSIFLNASTAPIHNKSTQVGNFSDGNFVLRKLNDDGSYKGNILVNWAADASTSFHVPLSGVNDIEVMRYLSGGNVGIGTSTPNVKLDVRTNASTAVTRFGGNGDAFAQFGASGTATQNWHLGSSYSTGAFVLFQGNYGAGTERVRVDSSGNVGIGTSSPVSYGLHITRPTANVGGVRVQSGTQSGDIGFNDAGGLYISNNSTTLPTMFWTNSAERARIDSAGNVGIGITSPSAKLDVNGSVNAGGSITTGRGVVGGDASIELGALRTGSGNCYIDFHTETGTDYDSRILRGGGVNANFLLENTGTGAIQITQRGAGPVALYTNNTERLRVNETGSVGIGISTPNSTLEVVGDITLYNRAVLGSRTGTTNGAVNITGGNTFFGGTGGAIVARGSNNGFNNGGVEIYYGDGTTTTEAVRINSSGNVGIGTGSPSYKLDVNGTLQAANIRFSSANVQTYSTPLTASGDFLVVNINGTDRKIRLWD